MRYLKISHKITVIFKPNEYTVTDNKLSTLNLIFNFYLVISNRPRGAPQGWSGIVKKCFSECCY
jgi:hypothetical protein